MVDAGERPDVVLVDLGGVPATLRRLIERVRHARDREDDERPPIEPVNQQDDQPRHEAHPQNRQLISQGHDRTT